MSGERIVGAHPDDHGLDDPLERHAGLIEEVADTPQDRGPEQMEHDLVVGDHERAEVCDGSFGP